MTVDKHSKPLPLGKVVQGNTKNITGSKGMLLNKNNNNKKKFKNTHTQETIIPRYIQEWTSSGKYRESYPMSY